MLSAWTVFDLDLDINNVILGWWLRKRIYVTLHACGENGRVIKCETQNTYGGELPRIPKL